jgi:hypothetical protein
LFFGLLFSTTGLCVLSATAWSLVVLILPFAFSKVLAFFPGLLNGAGHLAGGAFILGRQRTILDRKKGTLITIGGWFGISRKYQRLPLAVSVEPDVDGGPGSGRLTGFKISLSDCDTAPVPVAFASEEDSAHQIAREVETFLGPIQRKVAVSPADIPDDFNRN